MTPYQNGFKAGYEWDGASRIKCSESEHILDDVQFSAWLRGFTDGYDAYLKDNEQVHPFTALFNWIKGLFK